ncbi:PQQ-binding-like beta-propeller repeat protein [Phenylobacterium sp.]|uniref:outer membrane protein assembly factor BamB family protein n=1 Tax=Phenylobacterium sp. TaxID=1871053 RepID=UPI002E32F07B|nr:PQQ-binding-like beta-propeller repeat protein [Phenylobacterium sp.]HEX3366987.1 PQQ-binding-like beta-propeller repeat protein [Phenylobacterium sp.]
MRTMRATGVLAALAAVVLVSGWAMAQPPPAPPARPAVTPKAGYVVPPENSAGLYPVSGEPIFKARCAGCHEPATGRAPTREMLGARSPEEVYDALTIGAMAPMAQGMSAAEIYGVVRFLTGKSPVPQTASAPDPNPCKTNGPLQTNGPQWNGWGRDVANSRYQPKPDFAAADIPRLKVKWAFAYPGTKNTQPLVFGDRVFVASMGGKVYSLDAASGCVHWRFDYRGGGRASMTVGKLKTAPSGWALYFGDDRMYVRAFDASSGKELWKVRVGDHVVGRITGSPALYDGVLYVPLSASEESQGNVAAYPCCTFIGTVVAVDAGTGKILWSQAILNETPHPTRKNAAGTQMYGPAGGALWSAPTIDAKRGQLYVASGDSYSEVEHPTSDAVIAMDLKTGKIRWVNQVLAHDNFMSGTVNGPLGQRGPDYDFGSSPMLVSLGGRDLVITGNKSAIVYAMDPDSGKTVWQSAKLGSGGAGGGVEWGTATDGRIVYAALADFPGRGRPGIAGLSAADGKVLWQADAPKGVTCNVPSGRCLSGYSQAVTAVPGAVFAGALDGHLRAYAADGKLVWDYDTTTPLDTANGLKAASGGSLDMGGAVIAGGRLFIHSGYGGSAGANNLLLAFSVDGK